MYANVWTTKLDRTGLRQTLKTAFVEKNIETSCTSPYLISLERRIAKSCIESYSKVFFPPTYSTLISRTVHWPAPDLWCFTQGHNDDGLCIAPWWFKTNKKTVYLWNHQGNKLCASRNCVVDVLHVVQQSDSLCCDGITAGLQAVEHGSLVRWDPLRKSHPVNGLYSCTATCHLSVPVKTFHADMVKNHNDLPQV